MLVADCVSLILTCDRCHTIGLRPLPDCDGGLFFPSSHFTDDAMSAVRLMLTGIRSIGNVWYTDPLLVSDMLLQVRQSGIVYSRLLFRAKLKKSVCCKDMDGLQWMRMDSMSSLTSCWGPEPAIVSHLMLREKQDDEREDEQQSFSFPNLSEVRIMNKIRDFVPRLTADTSEKRDEWDARRRLAAAAGLTKERLVQLFNEFFQHSYPSAFWTQLSFTSYAQRMRWTGDAGRLFQAFLPYDQMSVTFSDFVQGVACMSQRVKHGARTGYQRMQRIVRWYDDERSRTLSLNEMLAMRRDIRRIGMRKKNKDKSEEQHEESEEEERTAVIADVVNDYHALGLDLHSFDAEGEVPDVTMEQLVAGISKKNRTGLRGTSSLFRLHFHFFKRLLHCAPGAEADSRCLRHRDADFAVAPHSVVIGASGSVTGSEADDGLLSACPAPSADPFDLMHPAQQTIALIHRLASQARSRHGRLTSETDNARDWTSVSVAEKRKRLNLMHEVCGRALRVFQSESRVPRVSSPCLVFGDTHGHLSDVLAYEQQFWPRAPLLPHSLLFLGDYVDRGLQSVEVFVYLLSLKCLSPAGRVLLLRGNHETRSMHAQFTFRAECVRKFGADGGQQVWQTFCAVMDCMPVAAVVDERLFCAHGGVPFSESSISRLRHMPVVVRDAEQEYAPGWEIMWNDPVDDETMDEIRGAVGSFPSDSQPDFVFNVKRGTGFLFNEQAVARFSLINQTSHLIRAHELVMSGFRLHFGGKAITVFSSSQYVGEDNTAACVLVQDDLLTPVQVTTC